MPVCRSSALDRTGTRLARGAAALAIVALGSVTSPASAEPTEQPAPTAPPLPQHREPSAGDLATARAALREGLVLREKGETTQALVRLLTAYDLVPTPVTAFELGKTHMILGHTLQAHELFKKVVRMPPSMEESTRSQTARDESARLAHELSPRIPSLRLKLLLPPGASASVRVDDDPIPAEILGASSGETVRAVDPGPHDVFAKAGDGPELKVHVDVVESETKDVAVEPEWVAPPRLDAGAKAPTQIIYVRQTNPLAFIGFGVAAASLVVMGVGLYEYNDAHAKAADRCGASYCPPSASRTVSLPATAVSDDLFQSNDRRANAAALVTIVAGVATIAFLGMGIIGASRPVKEKVVSTRGPVIRPAGPGVVGTF